jgi:hypothetical protein
MIYFYLQVKKTTHYYRFGGGEYEALEHKMIGGIYMASNVTGSCQLFDVKVSEPQKCIYDDDCNLEHLRHLFGRPRRMAANELIWMHGMNDRMISSILRNFCVFIRVFCRCL